LVSTNQKHRLASCSERPSFLKNCTICCATPVPALPAPINTARWSFTGTPVTFSALIIPPKITAPVPWMSSLKQQYFGWYFSNDDQGFLKSSNWTTMLYLISHYTIKCVEEFLPRPSFVQSNHQLIHKLAFLLDRNSLHPTAHIEGIVEKGFIIRSQIYRQW